MEVHHHSHEHHKKSWKAYFWEFLMLFLAVFCGFLAENQREHYVEKIRAKEYAKTLIEDLSADTVELLDVIREDKIILNCCDSINKWVQSGITTNYVTGKFYYYCNIGTFSPRVVWTKATLTQITQSGSLRYFRNSELVKKISSYYANIEFITGLNAGDVSYRDESIKMRNKILSNKYYPNYSAYSITQFKEIPDSSLTIKLPLYNNDPFLLNEFANSFETRRRVLKLLTSRYYAVALEDANELIEMLKQEYHLK